MTVLAFVVALAILVTVHEWGHYRVAVALGVRVERFSIGFGQPVITWRRHVHGQEIEFAIGYLPLGGYVKMLEEPLPEMTAEQSAMAFNVQSVGRRALIVLAGPVANLMLAIALSSAVAWLGEFEIQAVISAPQNGSAAQNAGLRSGDQILAAGATPHNARDITSFEDLRWWALSQDFSDTSSALLIHSAQTLHETWIQIPAFESHQQGLEALGINAPLSAPLVGEIMPNSAAEQAGLIKGDLVLAINGQRYNDAWSLRQYIRASGQLEQPQTQVWSVRREGQPDLELLVTPQRVLQDQAYIGRVGAQIGSMPQQVWVQSGAWEGLLKGTTRTLDVVTTTIQSIGQMLTGQLSTDNLTGPVGMAEYAGKAAEVGLTAYLSYLALISVSLFVLNLLPLPLLDGGHLLYYLLEVVRGRALSASTTMWLQRLGLGLIVLLSVFTLFNDLARLGW
jgi:regulator of sigma E protease